MKKLAPISHENPQIIEIRYNLTTKGSLIDQHDMKELACNLYTIYVNAEN